MTVGKQFQQEFNQAWVREDTDAILACVTDDIEFRMVGREAIRGKQAFEKMLRSMEGCSGLEHLELHHTLVDGDFAAVDGEIMMSGEGGQPDRCYICDIYKLRVNKIASITAYVVEASRC